MITKGEFVSDDLELLEILGRGGWGVVRRARYYQSGIPREVAVKCLYQFAARDPVAKKQLRREAESLSRLNHPNIVRLLGLKEIRDDLYLILELIEGLSTQELLAAVRDRGAGGLRYECVAAILHGVARALSAAHELEDEFERTSRVIHRDLSPDNIMIDKFGEIKVIDYGMAGIDQGIPGASLDTKAIFKSPYVAPEIVAEGQNKDPAADIYSLGVCGFELLTGNNPFSATDPNSVHFKKESFSKDEISRVLSTYCANDHFVSLIVEMMSFEKYKRPSAKSIQDRIDAILEEFDRARIVRELAVVSSSRADNGIQLISNFSVRSPQGRLHILIKRIGRVLFTVASIATLLLLAAKWLGAHSELIEAPLRKALFQTVEELPIRNDEILLRNGKLFTKGAVKFIPGTQKLSPIASITLCDFLLLSVYDSAKQEFLRHLDIQKVKSSVGAMRGSRELWGGTTYCNMVEELLTEAAYHWERTNTVDRTQMAKIIEKFAAEDRKEKREYPELTFRSLSSNARTYVEYGGKGKLRQVSALIGFDVYYAPKVKTNSGSMAYFGLVDPLDCKTIGDFLYIRENRKKWLTAGKWEESKVGFLIVPEKSRIAPIGYLQNETGTMRSPAIHVDKGDPVFSAGACLYVRTGETMSTILYWVPTE